MPLLQTSVFACLQVVHSGRTPSRRRLSFQYLDACRLGNRLQHGAILHMDADTFMLLCSFKVLTVDHKTYSSLSFLHLRIWQVVNIHGALINMARPSPFCVFFFLLKKQTNYWLMNTRLVGRKEVSLFVRHNVHPRRLCAFGSLVLSTWC